MGNESQFSLALVCCIVAISLQNAFAVTRKPYPKHLEKISYWRSKLFDPEESQTFKLIFPDGVDLHYLDKTNFKGYDGQDYVTMGDYTVETRLGLLTECNTPLCRSVDGIVGFGWTDRPSSAALLKTLTSPDRADWDITQSIDFSPMPRSFAFTASHDFGELQLGGYDADSIDPSDSMQMFPMVRDDYGVKVESITYGDGPDAVELLQFQPEGNPLHRTGYIGKFDSGTTCVLMPNTTMDGILQASPFEVLLDQQLKGIKRSLFYTFKDVNGEKRKFEIEYDVCVSPSSHSMIFGDPWFRKWVVYHDLEDLNAKAMGLALRAPDYKLAGEVPLDDDESETTEVVGSARGGKTGGNDVAEDDDEAIEDNDKAASAPRAARHERVRRGLGRAGSLAQRGRGGKGEGRKVHKVPARRWLANQAHQQELARLVQLAAAPDASDDEYIDGFDEDSLAKVALKSHHRVVYNVLLQVGTPPQLTEVVFDTGSYMFAIFSKPPPPSDIQPIGKLPHYTLTSLPRPTTTLAAPAAPARSSLWRRRSGRMDAVEAPRRRAAGGRPIVALQVDAHTVSGTSASGLESLRAPLGLGLVASGLVLVAALLTLRERRRRPESRPLRASDGAGPAAHYGTAESA